MHSLKTILIFAASALILCSCVDTPANLKKRETLHPKTDAAMQNDSITTKNSNSDNAEIAVPVSVTSKKERGSLKAIRSQLSLDLKKTYKNISIDYARVSEAETMPTYDIEIGINPDFEFDSLLERLYSDWLDVTDERYYTYYKTGDPINEGSPARTEPEYGDDGKSILRRNVYDMDITIFSPDYKKDPTFSTIAYSTGNIFGSQCGGGLGHGNKWFSYDNYSLCKQYYLMNEQPAADEAYTLVDGNKWNALEAIEFVEDFWNDHLSSSDTYSFTYSVKALYVVKIDDSHFAYLFEMQCQDEAGNYYDVDHSDFYFSDKSVLAGEPFEYTNRLVTYCAEKESISRFGKGITFKPEDKTDDGDNLLTLGAASDILSKALASNVNLSLTAELNYMIICKGYHCADDWIKKDYYDTLCVTESDFEIQPYWCFKPVGQCFLMNELEAERYYVDAVTGEVSTITRGFYQKYSQTAGGR